MRLRLWASTAIAVATLGMAACGGDPDESPGAGATTPPGTAGLGAAPSSTTPPVTPSATPSSTKPAAVAAPLTCGGVRNATLGSPTVRFNDYDGIPLLDGVWSGEDGNSITVKICGVGDLNGDGAVDALAAVELDAGGTGKFWSLAAWRNTSGSPVFAAVKELGDRTPVQSITITGNRATVVYLTRGDSDPMAAITTRRTAIFRVSGVTLTEVSHSDEPYTP
jgi:hypothetical protein